MADQLTTQQFAAKVRAKYPGAYDSLSDADLTQKVLAKYPDYAPMVQSQRAQAAAPPAEDTGAIAGVKRALSGFVHLPGQVYDAFAQPPQNDYEKQLAQRGTADLALDRIFAGPARAEQQKAVQAYTAGDEHMGNMHNIAAAVPIVGPIAGGIAQRYIQGDKSGAAAELGTFIAAPEIAGKVVAKLPDAAAAISPRGALSGKMGEVVTEVPNAQPITRGELVSTARTNGVNLDLADATGSPTAGAAKSVVKRSLGGVGTFTEATKANVQALHEWGGKVLNDASPVELNREQTGNLVKQNLLKQQSNMYDQASQYFDQIDRSIGAAKPKPAMIQEMAQQVLDENKSYYDKHPDLLPKRAWNIIEDLAEKPKATPPTEAPTGILDASGNQLTKTVPGKPAPLDTWSDLHKLRSDLMNMYRTNPEIVGTRAEGWLKQMVGSIDNTMMDSAARLSPMDADLFRKANGIYEQMKGTYDNPQHPFYHIVRAMDGTTAGNAAANLKPEFVRQLQGAMGNSFSVFQRDAVARILDPKNSGQFDFKNLNARLTRADVEKLSTVLSPAQMRDLQMLNQTGRRVMGNVNPSGTSDVVVPAADLTNLVHNPVLGGATIAGEYGTARAMTNPRVVDFLTGPKAKARVLKPNNRIP